MRKNPEKAVGERWNIECRDRLKLYAAFSATPFDIVRKTYC